MDIKKLYEIAQEAGKKLDIAVEFVGDAIEFDGWVGIGSDAIVVERRSLRGKVVTEEQGWVVTEAHLVSGTPDTPDDVDVDDVYQTTSPYQALEYALGRVRSVAVSSVIERFQMDELAEDYKISKLVP